MNGLDGKLNIFFDDCHIIFNCSCKKTIIENKKTILLNI